MSGSLCTTVIMIFVFGGQTKLPCRPAALYKLAIPLIYRLLLLQETSGSPASLWASQQAPPHSHLIPPQGLRHLCARLPPSCCCLADLLPPPCPTRRKYLERKISGKMEPSMSFRTTSCVPDPLTAGSVIPLLCGTIQLSGWRAEQTIPIRNGQRGV